MAERLGGPGPIDNQNTQNNAPELTPISESEANKIFNNQNKETSKNNEPVIVEGVDYHVMDGGEVKQEDVLSTTDSEEDKVILLPASSENPNARYEGNSEKESSSTQSNEGEKTEEKVFNNEITEDEFVEKIKKANIFDLSVDEDVRNQKALEILDTFKLKVNDVESFYLTEKDSSKSERVKGMAKKEKEILGRVVYRALAENEDPDKRILVVAGSYSVESVLPSKLKGLGDVVANNFTNNRDIRGALETVDVIKNDPDLNQDGFLLQQVKAQKSNLERARVDFTKKDEMLAKAKATKYLNDLQNELGGGVSDENKNNDRRNNRNKDNGDKTENGNNGEEKEYDMNDDRYERLYTKETSVKQLTKIARANLDRIEGMEELSNRYRLTGQPTDVLDTIMYRLENGLIDNAEGEEKKEYDLLRKEIKARLTIFDIGKLASDVSFRISDRGGMSDIIDQAAKMNRIMDREVLTYCFSESSMKDDKGKEVGFDIPAAWDLIQKANFDYRSILKEAYNSGFAKDYKGDEKQFLNVGKTCVEGRGVGLFLDKDRDPSRALIVENYIISKLGKNGKKAYQLANELVNATGERPAFNFDFVKGDNFSEAIYFRDYRNDDASKGKKVGPYASRGIQSLAHGWLRYFSRSTDLSDQMGPIDSEEVVKNLHEMKGKKDSIMYFCKILPSYVGSVKSALMDSDPDPKKILNISHLQELTGSFDKVDVPMDMIPTSKGWETVKIKDKKFTYNGTEYTTYDKGGDDKFVNINGKEVKVEKSRGGQFAMKSYYVLGLLELFATKENIGWEIGSMRKLRELLVDTKLSESTKPFITEAQWNWALEQKIANDGKGKDLTFMQAMRMNGRARFMDNFFDSFVNGNKKR